MDNVEIHSIWVHPRLCPRVLSGIAVDAYTVEFVHCLIVVCLVATYLIISGHLVVAGWA